MHTIFFGGGTPSLLSPQQVSQILSTVRDSFEVVDGAEITMEANPGTVTDESLAGYADAGVNRFSFGMQASDPVDLHTLDRSHTYIDVLKAVKGARMAGMEHLNLDLIFGIPGQPIERWRRSLELAAATGVDHLSLYALTIEEGTPLYHWANHGLIEMPDDDLAADMYELADEYLASMGYEQYEISNWARGKDARCKHNLQYWEYESYYGFGAGAHGFVDGARTENVHPIPEYLQMMHDPKSQHFPASSAAIEVKSLTQWDQMQEMMMVGLRLTNDGVSSTRYKRKFGVEIEDAFAEQIKRLLHEGLIEWIEVPERAIRLTERGRLLGNQVFLEFIGNDGPSELSQVAF